MLTQIVRMLQQKIPSVKREDGSQSESSLIDQFCGIDFQTTMQCDDAPDEPSSKSIEKQYQFSCFISADVKYMHTGLRLRLTEKITKSSPMLGQDSQYTKHSLISRLPAYLTIQFVRFYYKEKEKVNAKILKDVKFAMSLDVFDMCTPELQEKLKPMREKFKDEDERQLQKKIAEKGGEAMNTDLALPPKTKAVTLPYSFSDDIGSNNSGFYELSAVLTHRGRSSSSGHYVAWVRQTDKTWCMCDDDNMLQVKDEDILKLSGGGDWHCAYVLLYAPKQLTLEEVVVE